MPEPGDQIGINAYNEITDRLKIESAHDYSEWIASAVSGMNAAVDAERPAEAGRAHYVSVLDFGYGQSASGEGRLLVDGAPVARFRIATSRTIALARPHKVPAGAAVSVDLAAGGIGVTGAVNLFGYTLDE